MATQRCWFLNSSVQSRGHGGLKSDVQQFSSGTAVVVAVYAPDSNKCLDMYEECILSVAKVLREGRKGGAPGDFNVELGLM